MPSESISKIPTIKPESEFEREERLRVQRDDFRRNLNELRGLDVLSKGKEREQCKISMQDKYSKAFPGLMDYIMLPIYKENGEIKDPLQKVYDLINPPNDRPLDMNWHPPRLEKKQI